MVAGSQHSPPRSSVSPGGQGPQIPATCHAGSQQSPNRSQVSPGAHAHDTHTSFTWSPSGQQSPLRSGTSNGSEQGHQPCTWSAAAQQSPRLSACSPSGHAWQRSAGRRIVVGRRTAGPVLVLDVARRGAVLAFAIDLESGITAIAVAVLGLAERTRLTDVVVQIVGRATVRRWRRRRRPRSGTGKTPPISCRFGFAQTQPLAVVRFIPTGHWHRQDVRLRTAGAIHAGGFRHASGSPPHCEYGLQTPAIMSLQCPGGHCVTAVFGTQRGPGGGGR